jgi:hypothetical protein
VCPGPRARDWAISFGGGEEAHYRRQWCALHVSVRLLHTQKPARQVHDMWAWAPCQGLDRWLRRRRGGALPRGGSTLLVRWFTFLTVCRGEDEGGALPRGGSTLFVRRFAFLTVGRGEDEGVHYRKAVACSLCDGSPSSHLKTRAPAV